jgi:hypothetical protein
MSTITKTKHSHSEREMIRKEVLAREIAAFDQYVMEKAMGKHQLKTDEKQMTVKPSFGARSVS